MTENRYDDQLLSTIIDGEASPEIIAAVEADEAASQRLIDLRAAVTHVATPVPEATPEKRSASIAAAMATATPASPEVTSLSAKRHEKQEEKKRFPTGWLIAAAAAVLLFVLAIPVFLNDTSTDFATDAASDASLSAESADATEELVERAATSDDGDEEAMEDEEEEAMEDEEEEAMEDEEEEAMEDEEEEAMEDEEEDAGDATVEAAGVPADLDLDLEVVPSIEELNVLIEDTTVAPNLAGNDILAIETLQARSSGDFDEVLATEVNPECLVPGEGVTNPTPYSLVVLDPFAGPAQLVIIEFGDDGTTRLLDAETCGVIG